MKRIFLVIFLTVASLISSFAKTYALEGQGAAELKLYLGQIKIIHVVNPTRIVIGNPNIADVSDITTGEITVTPRAVGATTLVFWDSYGEQSFHITVSAEDMAEIKRRIDNMLVKLNVPEVYTKAEDEENKVLLLGRVKSALDREKISLALGPLKDKAMDLIELREEESVVEISVEVMELDKGATSTLGFTWPSSVTLTEAGSPGLTGGEGAKWSTLFAVVKGTRDAFTLKLDALIQEGKARLLSRPRLACQSGKEAELLVGGEKPIFTTTVASTTGAEGTTVEYKEYGIKLKIKPTVTDENRIKVALNVEVTELESTTPETIGSATAPTAKAYPLTKRNTSTELFLDNEQTLAIGGLIKQRTSEELRKLPWLGEIPVLGMFFRQKTTSSGSGYNTKGDAELFITLTPKIVASPEKNVAVKDKDAVNPESSPLSVNENPSEQLAVYRDIIKKLILENLAYPDSARLAGLQGTVKITLHLSSQGELLEALIKSSSGYKSLDENAVQVAKRIVSYPSFPPSVELKDLWVEVPIVYKID